MAASVAVKRVENVTDCAICAGDLNDARVLPCVHTFCLDCIDKWTQNKKPGEKASCPICREEFEIPEGGMTALPKNRFVDKLLEVKKVSTTLSLGDVVCDVCCDDKEDSEKKETKKATVYCVDCRRNMCEQCCGYHQKFRLPGVHRLIELNSEMNVDELLLKFPENMCQKHADKGLEIYCFDCKAAVCMTCCGISHKSHKCSDIKGAAGELGKQLSGNVENLAAKVTKCETVLKNIEENEKKFRSSVAETERLISERAERLKQLIDNHKDMLLDQLSVSKDKQLKQTANVRDELERHQIILENFIRYSNEVKQKGTSSDIVKLARELNARAEELQKFEVGTDLSVEYDVTEVNFTIPPTDDDLKRVFGNLTMDVEAYFKLSGEVVHTIQNPNSTVGIAAVNDLLYVSNTRQIKAYCPTTFRENNLNITCMKCKAQVNAFSCAKCHHGLQSLCDMDMVGCAANNCLYASYQRSSYIGKVAFGQNSMLSSWNVPSHTQGLSVTSSHNLLVALSDTNSFCEYSTDGVFIRQISVQPAGISNPMHVVQLSDDHYAVIHHGPTHQFSIVSSYGQIVQSYRGNAGNMNQPQRIAVDEQGRVFVADERNNRILVINLKTLSAHPLQLTADCKLRGPCIILFDQVNRRLYIGEGFEGRVICCQL